MVLVPDRERDALASQAEVAALEHATVVVGEHREEHDVAEPSLGRVPVDVEVRRVTARGAVLQDVPPPGVVGSTDGHVIGDDVEHLPEARFPQRLGQTGVARRAAELAVDGARIDDVVAVRAALRGLEIRGAVEVADAELREIVRDRCGRGEVEAGVELDAVGGAELSLHVRGAAGRRIWTARPVHAESLSPAHGQDNTGKSRAPSQGIYRPANGPRSKVGPYSATC